MRSASRPRESRTRTHRGRCRRRRPRSRGRRASPRATARRGPQFESDGPIVGGTLPRRARGRGGRRDLRVPVRGENCCLGLEVTHRPVIEEDLEGRGLRPPRPLLELTDRRQGQGAPESALRPPHEPAVRSRTWPPGPRRGRSGGWRSRPGTRPTNPPAPARGPCCPRPRERPRHQAEHHRHHRAADPEPHGCRLSLWSRFHQQIPCPRTAVGAKNMENVDTCISLLQGPISR